MDAFSVYRDIQTRTRGQFLIGVVGPVRTGKSTFIRRFMEVLALPKLEEKQQSEVRDALPLSGSGKMITTVEPKFIPKEALSIQLGEGEPVKLRLIDCVGFLVPEAVGNMENNQERMVKTPWFEEEIPFHQAAEIGTKKVIAEHSTIGLLITCDGSFGELPRENFRDAEERTVKELQKQGKPFLILVNSQKPYREETQKLVRELEQKYHVCAMAINCDQLRKEDIIHILEKILYEFPLRQIAFYIPKWVELMPPESPVKSELLAKIRELCQKLRYVRDIQKETIQISSDYIHQMSLWEMDLSTGIAKIRIDLKEQYYYEMLSDMTGVSICGEYDLIQTLKELSAHREEYEKVQNAITAVRSRGYGVVIPGKEEITLEEPVVIRQGNKFGVKIKSTSPSIHMIKANIETEIAPIVGNEQQAKDLIAYIKENAKQEAGIWNTNIFGKSIEQLVEDGIRNKIAGITEESQVKLQDSMQKIVNDSKGGMVCIII
ncbi:MAG: stage IV sporulation protein A [Fusicatenibacter sp.]|nr:stage IV sporulation protein A [Lachnospiraceae bacterium]MDY2937455.1 stage IV sporulation protein A [Fusicatenibacter sp.]